MEPYHHHHAADGSLAEHTAGHDDEEADVSDYSTSDSDGPEHNHHHHHHHHHPHPYTDRCCSRPSCKRPASVCTEASVGGASSEAASTSGLPEAIAHACLDRYNHVVPRTARVVPPEWTVLAGIVATGCGAPEESFGGLQVIALATGNKCIGRSAVRDDGFILRDSHAEVIARRILLRHLWLEVEKLGAGKPSCLLVKCADGKYQLAPGVQLHLYVSDSPCGDASILGTPAHKKPREFVSLHRHTGARDAVHPDQTDTDEHKSATVGHVRTKSCRSDMRDADKTHSMSCTDKICRWCVLGLQGALLSTVLHPVYLSSIVVSADDFGAAARYNLLQAGKDADGLPPADLDAAAEALEDTLEKCFRRRVLAADPSAKPPAVYVNRLMFASSRGSAADFLLHHVEQPKHPKLIAAGTSINCDLAGTVEKTGANTGRQQGATTTTPWDKTRSRLCQQQLFATAMTVLSTQQQSQHQNGEGSSCACGGRTYHQWKLASPAYAEKRTQFLKSSEFIGWASEISSKHDNFVCPRCRK